MAERIVVVNYKTKPLKKHHYTKDEIKVRPMRTHTSGSGVLIDRYRERERAEEEAKQEFVKKLQESGLLTGDYVPPAGFEQPKDPVKPKRLKKQRFRFSIYDYSDVELDELEQEIAELINQDGFYDEIEPLDKGNQALIKPEMKNKKIIIGLVIAAIAVLVFGILYIASLF